MKPDCSRDDSLNKSPFVLTTFRLLDNAEYPLHIGLLHVIEPGGAKMTVISLAVKSTQDAAEAYVRSRRNSQILSTERAIRAIRTLMPKCTATDRELADMLAALAVARGLCVSFDGAAAATQAVDDAPDPIVAPMIAAE
jgi:hypothetical protein